MMLKNSEGHTADRPCRRRFRLAFFPQVMPWSPLMFLCGLDTKKFYISIMVGIFGKAEYLDYGILPAGYNLAFGENLQ